MSHSTAAPLNYVLCDTPTAYAKAAQDLRQLPILVVDCEGYNLGKADGNVTLICVGTFHAERIYLFDTLSPLLSKADIEPLLQLLHDRNILKLVWDGRMDYLEIWSTYGVSLEGVLDLQIAEVTSRVAVRGEGEVQRVERLARGYFSCLPVYSYLRQYEGLNAVIGLQRCWTDCGFSQEVGKDPEVVNMHKANKSTMWTERPLTEQLLQYAAKDIFLIATLYSEFYRRGWIPRDIPHWNGLLAQSQRYISAHREQGKCHDRDIFRPCGIIPLDVLTQVGGVKHPCMACNRLLSISSFETAREHSLNRLFRHSLCRLCFVLALKNNIQAQYPWLLA